MQRGGFTLVEVMVVVTLMGLVAASTAWSLAEDARSSSRTKVVADIVHADRMARLAAQRRGQPCMLQFDLQRHRLWRVTGPVGSGETSHVTTLPGRSRIDRILTAAGESSSDITTTSADAGLAMVRYSRTGCSDSYALRLMFEDGGAGESHPDELSGGSAWMVFAGLTGQLTLVQNEAEVEKIFAMLANGRADAN